jgi:hypothetical protein
MLLNILMLMIIYAVLELLELKDMFVRVNKPVAEE